MRGRVPLKVRADAATAYIVARDARFRHDDVAPAALILAALLSPAARSRLRPGRAASPSTRSSANTAPMSPVHIEKCDHDGDGIYTRTELLCVSGIYQADVSRPRLTAACGGRCRPGLGSRMTDAPIHPPPPAFRLFAARRRDPGQEARRPLPGRRTCPPSRSPTPATSSPRSNFPKPSPRPASSRSWAASSPSPMPSPPTRATAPPPRGPSSCSPRTPTGFGNLMRLSSRNYLDCGAALPHVTLAQLAAHAEGLICLTGGAEGPLGALIRDGHAPRARALAEHLAALFPGRLYVEIQRHPENGAPRTPGRGGDRARPRRRSPTTSTCRSSPPTTSQFPAAAIYDAHDALLCIAEGAYVDQQAPRRRLTPEHRFKSQDEMVALFADLPEAVANTVEIARRCAFRPQKRKPILPRFAEDEVEELRRQAREGLDARLAVIPNSAPDETYRRAPRVRARRHRGHGLPRLLPHRRRLHQVGQGARHPRRPRPRLGRRLARRLRAHHHRPRPPALRPPLRAVPQPRPHLDARLRHRLLHGPPRGGHRLRSGTLRPRARGADHHLRRAPLQGRRPRRRPRAADALRPGRPPLQAHPRRGREARLHRQGARRRAPPARGGPPRPPGRPPARDLRPDRGPAAQRLHPRRRRRHRRPPAGGAGAALPRPALGHAGDPVQHEVGRGSGPGEVRLPRPQDPHRHPATRSTSSRPAASTIDIGAIPLDDAKTYEVYASAQTVAVFQVESTGMRTALRQLKPTCIEDIIALVALYRPGPMENIPKFCNVKNGRETARKPSPLHRPHPRRDPRASSSTRSR